MDRAQRIKDCMHYLPPPARDKLKDAVNISNPRRRLIVGDRLGVRLQYVDVTSCSSFRYRWRPPLENRLNQMLD